MADEIGKAKVAQPATEEKALKEIVFKQIRTGLFRCIHADGAWGSINGQGNIALSFFNERPPLPDSVTYSSNNAGGFVATKSSENNLPIMDHMVLRQYEAEIIMTLNSAKIIHSVLGNFIKMVEDANSLKE